MPGWLFDWVSTLVDALWTFVVDAGSAVLALGILGALVAYVLRAREDRIQHRRELHGLLRLLDVEIETNGFKLSEWKERRDEMPISPPLADEAWKEVRARLSQLLRSETQFADFARYYQNLAWIDSVRLDPAYHPISRANIYRDFLPLILEQHELVKKHVREYIPQSTQASVSEVTTPLPVGTIAYPPPPREHHLDGMPTTVSANKLPGVLSSGVDRVLIVERYHSYPPGTSVLSIPEFEKNLKDSGRFSLQEGWRVVSHTFAYQDDGMLVVTYLLERATSKKEGTD